MKKIVLLLCVLSTVVFTNAQSTVIRDANAETRNITSFHAIEVSNGIRLILKQGNTDAVAVSASSTDLISKIKTEVSNGKLKIYFDHSGWKNWNSKGKELKAYVTIRNIDALEANSGANATTDGNINTTDMKISLSSGADFNGQVTASKLWIDQSSGSDMEIKGKVNYVEIKTSSGSDFNGYDLVSETCKADASSGSGIEITVNKELSAHATGASDIHYKGDGLIREIKTSGASNISKRS